MKQNLVFLSLLASLLAAGCHSTHLPTSSFPGLASTTTGQLRLADSVSVSHQPQGWPDDQVLLFKPQACTNSFIITPLALNRIPRADRRPVGPGVVLISNEELGIDEAEIPNREWRHYVAAQRQAGLATADLLPRPAALPVPDYFTNRFYDFYPVVGISYEQAQAFCRWRGQVVSAAYGQGVGQSDTLATGYARFTYRLPTEAEWEHAALVMSKLPFGSSCTVLPVQVPPGAAAYLKQRSGSTESTATIRAAIKAYNASRPVRNSINYAQAGPAFLTSPTPGYIYQGPPNAFGLYQLLGNVAELVQEKGLTKGGSYRSPLADCRIKARGTYAGPAPTIGFRAVATVSYPNRLAGR